MFIKIDITILNNYNMINTNYIIKMDNNPIVIDNISKEIIS